MQRRVSCSKSSSGRVMPFSEVSSTASLEIPVERDGSSTDRLLLPLLPLPFNADASGSVRVALTNYTAKADCDRARAICSPRHSQAASERGLHCCSSQRQCTVYEVGPRTMQDVEPAVEVTANEREGITERNEGGTRLREKREVGGKAEQD